MELRNKDKIRMAGVTLTVVNDTYSVYVFDTEDGRVLTVDKVLLDDLEFVRLHNIPAKNHAVIRLIGDNLVWRVFERGEDGYWRSITDWSGGYEQVDRMMELRDSEIGRWIDEAGDFEVLYEGDNE